MRATRRTVVVALVAIGVLAVPLFAYADPAPLVDPNPPVGIEGGGDWSTYWYDGYIYEGDMTRGLIVWKLNDRAARNSIKLGRLNPQTQEFSIDSRNRNRDR